MVCRLPRQQVDAVALQADVAVRGRARWSWRLQLGRWPCPLDVLDVASNLRIGARLEGGLCRLDELGAEPGGGKQRHGQRRIGRLALGLQLGHAGSQGGQLGVLGGAGGLKFCDTLSVGRSPWSPIRRFRQIDNADLSGCLPNARVGFWPNLLTRQEVSYRSDADARDLCKVPYETSVRSQGREGRPAKPFHGERSLSAELVTGVLLVIQGSHFEIRRYPFFFDEVGRLPGGRLNHDQDGPQVQFAQFYYPSPLLRVCMVDQMPGQSLAHLLTRPNVSDRLIPGVHENIRPDGSAILDEFYFSLPKFPEPDERWRRRGVGANRSHRLNHSFVRRIPGSLPAQNPSDCALVCPGLGGYLPNLLPALKRIECGRHAATCRNVSTVRSGSPSSP